MRNYVLTVFAQDGEKLLDESFPAENDTEAKKLGEEKLQEKNYQEHTHRCVTPEAKLILFHR